MPLLQLKTSADWRKTLSKTVDKPLLGRSIFRIQKDWQKVHFFDPVSLLGAISAPPQTPAKRQMARLCN
ncbi:hypothetical protein [Pseudomonas sp. nanlin1]|uniref:hypothetical protein n=1 Tax=Pseudomonas sp. nanlin1 TaxID=3040605 RepID=UPI00388D8BA2